MAKVLMYSTGVCPFCLMAERLLKSKGVADIEKVRVDLDPPRRQEMMERTFSMSATPLDLSRRSAIRQNGHTPVEYISTFAMRYFSTGRLACCHAARPPFSW